MSGLLTFTDKSDPAESFVLNTRMPSGTVQNMLAAIKVVNAIRLGECKFTAEDIRRAGSLGTAMKKMITDDNDRYYRVFDRLREVQRGVKLTAPDLTGHNLPEFEICEAENDVTLTTKDYGRGCVIYDVGLLFGPEALLQPTSEAWKSLLKVVINAWGLAEAAAIHPDQINSWANWFAHVDFHSSHRTSCSRGRRNWCPCIRIGESMGSAAV